MSTTYYQNYQGPELLSCELDGVDHTSSLQECYGSKNDWKQTLYRYREIFGDECLNKKFKITYLEGNQTYWEYGFILDPEQYYLFRKIRI